MTAHAHRVAEEKTKNVLLTKKRIPIIFPMSVSEELIETKKAVKYLGVTIDNKLTFWEHIQRTADKALSDALSPAKDAY